MRVRRNDGSCRECGGDLEIIDASDETMSVECIACGEFYEVESDAFQDGAVVYYPRVLAQKLQQREED